MSLKSRIEIHYEASKNPGNIISQFLLICLLAVPIIVPFFLNPSPALSETHRQLLLPPCPFYHITGIPCPLCGATTSLTLLTHGQIIRSFIANPVGPLLYFIFIAFAVILIKSLIKHQVIKLLVSFTGLELLILIIIIWGLKLISWGFNIMF